MRGINVVILFLCSFCLLHTAIGQSFDARVNLVEGKSAGHQVHSFPTPASNQRYTFFPAQDADSKAALTLFQISEQGVVTTTKPIDFETGEKNYYDLVAIRRNRGDKEGGTPLSIRITITDTNNFSPTFPANFYHGRVKEDSPANTIVMGLENCFAEDRDTVGSISYSISSGNEQGYFKAEKATEGNRAFLVLKTTNTFEKLERDVTPEVNLTVRANDGVRYGTAKVTVKILDANNNIPVFDEDSYSATINEDTPLLTSVLRVRATDQDEGTNGGVYYYLSVSSQWFSVDAITGVVKVVSQLPNQALVTMDVIARDRGTPSNQKTVKVNININLLSNYPLPDAPNPGVNTPPFFPEESYSANVREDFPVGAAVLIIHAVDRDPPGRNRRIRYSLSGDNAFAIDQTSGVVTLRNLLDFAIKNKYDLNVVATDGGASPQSGTATLTIIVQEVDKNRHAPVFQSASANKQQRAVAVRENSAADTKVGSSISATDADGSQKPEGQVVFSIASGSGLPYFKIDQNSGDLQTVTVLDTEKQAQYNLLIEARDKALYPLYSHLYMMITVTGEDDNNPDFSQPVYYANVPGKAPANTFVTQIHATDKDGDPVSYSIENPGNAFLIQTDSGVISTRRMLDPANEERSFSLSVRATSRAKESQAQVIVTVISEENSPPTFVNLPYTATVPENLGRIESLLCLAAKDSQGKTVKYALVSNTDGKFSVDEKSGRFSATGSLDYESYTGGVYQVQALSSPLQVATEKVTIKVTDTTDPPRFSKSKYTFQINEDIAPGTTVTITNQDGSSRGLVINDADTPKTQFTCSIENVKSLDVGNQFKVVLDASNIKGECKLVTQSSFDHFDAPKFTFDVQATDVNYPNMFASAEVEIEIVDKNNHNPVFSQTDYWTSVSSNFPVRNSILKITATDKDAGSFGEITYQLLDFEDRNRFSIDSSTGVLTSANSLATKRYQLTVQASDRAQNSNDVRRSSVSVYVFVYNPGTTVIQFNAASYSKIIPEDAATNTPVFTVSAKGPSGIKYKIVGGNTNDKFKIVQNTGLVSVAGPLDRESKSSYQLVIRAETPQLAQEVTTTINIGDVNDNKPRIMFLKDPKTIAVEDYSPKGTFVIKVFAIDRDVADNGVVKYSIITQSTPFQINQDTGVITASREIRLSEKQSWDIDVQATDGKGQQSPAFTLKIVVTRGVQPPQLQATYSVSLDENKAVGFPVKDISPALNNDNYKYSIIDGNRDDAFCINHAGVISVARPLDREKKDSYSLKVSVSVGNKVTNTTVDVTIRDKNDDAPEFTKPVYTFDVSENKGINEEVGKVSATDFDSGRNGEIEYQLLYAVDLNSKFRVNPNTGSITTLAELDYEQIRQHILYIGAADKGVPSLSTIAKVVLNVRDVNDQTPKFSADSYVSKVALDAKVDSQVLLVVATDLDNGDNGKVVFNITGGNDEGAFKIDPDTGVLKVKRSLTTVSASRFTLEVEAKDKGNPPLRKTATVQLNVFLPDGPPRFVVKPVIQEVTEGVKANERVMVVKAATSEALTYEITSGNEGGLFRMVPSTGEIRVMRELDYEEAREHELVVRVMDSRDRSDQVTVVIKVKNINDNPPEFPGEVGGVVERKVEDDFRIGDNVARLSAVDKDGDTISYTSSSDVRSLFSINNEGFLIAKKPRDDFTSPVKFQLTAKDSGSPPRETKVEVQLVLVSYRGDQQPVRVYVREDKSVGSVIAIVPRYFPGGKLSIIYPRNSNFSVDNSGKVRMEAPFDYEEQQFFSLTVRETEPAPRSRTNDVDVEINVVDINDNKPVMKMIDFFGRVNTNSRPGVKAYQLKAEDKDGGLAGRIGYQMVSRNVPFGINPLTDVVETAGELEERGGYNVTVYGFDYGVPRQFGESVYLDMKTVNFKPVFSENLYEFPVFEKELPGKPVGKVNATSVSGARLGFAIIQGDSDSKFVIDNSGQIRVNSLLDREKQAVYNLKVRATEQIPRGYSNDVDVQIVVTNANEHFPYFPQLVYQKSISENVGAGAQVLRVAAYDCDCKGCSCSRGDLTYSLEGTSLFRIDKVTGDISVGDSALDYEAQRKHTFAVDVQDFGEKKFSSRAYVKVIVQNANDEVPSFQESEYNIGIAEDAVRNKPLAAIVARDADGDTPSYSITSGDGGNIFKIDPSTGVLSLTQSVKGKQTQYTLQVRATDTRSSKSDEVRVIVNIEDINDNRPVFPCKHLI